MAVYFVSTDDLAGFERLVRIEGVTVSPSVDPKSARMYIYREVKVWKQAGPRANGDLYRQLVFANALPGRDEELNHWYDAIHANDILAVPGVVGFRRFAFADAVLGSSEMPPQYLSMMDFKTDSVEQFSVRLDRAGDRSPNPDAFDRAHAWRQLYQEAGPSIVGGQQH
jgi:hypothetical protein